MIKSIPNSAKQNNSVDPRLKLLYTVKYQTFCITCRFCFM